MKTYGRSVLVLLGLFALLGPAWGQGSIPVPKVTTDEKNELNKLASGELPTTKATLPLIEKMSEYLVYRAIQTGGDEKKAITGRNSAITDLENLVERSRNSKTNKAFVDAFAPKLTDKIKQVLVQFRETPGNEIPILYAAQMLPVAAKLKHESVGDFLVSIIEVKTPKTDAKGKDETVVKDGKDKDGKSKDGKAKEEKTAEGIAFNKHPAVQLYAAKALREFFPVRIIQAAEDWDAEDGRRKGDIRRIEALSRYIEQSWPMDRMDSGAVRFIRREAIASLADVQAPAVSALKEVSKKGGFGAAEGSPVPTMMNVLVKGMMTPEPGLMEKHHAAMGLLRLQNDKVPDYQPEAGMFLVGNYFIEYAIAYNKEYNLLQAKKIVATVPWKQYADHIKTHLADLQKHTTASPTASKAAKQLNDATMPVLANILATQRIDEGNLNALRIAVASVRPKGDDIPLFKVVKGPSIKIEGK